ncbi:response regulator, partial [Achromobacter xylosoxidans]
FTVTLPKKQASAADGKVAHDPVAGNATMQARQEASRWLANASPALASAGAANRPRILCADDNADLREYLRSLLAADYDVRIAADGATALRSARQDPPDLVITDIMMPGMDGLTLLQALRGDARTRTVPVILLSARRAGSARRRPRCGRRRLSGQAILARRIAGAGWRAFAVGDVAPRNPGGIA